MYWYEWLGVIACWLLIPACWIAAKVIHKKRDQ
jgi:hypothetical protein